jgi:lon-related putative ATP-dependent protease
MKKLEAIIGQERALKSLQFGLGIKGNGFNIFVAGRPGTGRTTAIKNFLEEKAKSMPVPNDLCYVNNFRNPYHPKALSLPSDRGRELQSDMKKLIESTRTEIHKAFESEEYVAKKEQTTKSLQQEKNRLFAQINEKAQKEGFTIQSSSIGLLTIPVKDGKPLSEEEFNALHPKEKEKIAKKREEIQAKLKDALRQAKNLDKTIIKEIQKLDQEVALNVIGHLIEDLKEKYNDLPEVISYLHEVQDDILENLSIFRSESKAQHPSLIPIAAGLAELSFKKYEINLLIDNSSLKAAPVIIELNPTYNNLFGRIEKEAQFGTLVTGFTLIREGSLHRANGGYMVIPAMELLRNIFSWDSLKRALRNKEITIEEAGERLGLITSKSLSPEPVPLDIKVILVGQPMLYYLLYNYDEDFEELFKVKADFDTQMDRNEKNIKDYAAFVCTVCEMEKLKHLDSTALAKLVEHGSRLAGDQEKLSTHFGKISDVIKEACYYAAQEDTKYVTGPHISKAIDEKLYRSNLLQERIREMIERGTILVDVDGEKVAQVNGLSVINLGDITFGRPSKISVSIGLGKKGLIDIEREAKLGGPIHSKGVMILSGYLSEKYAQDKPLSLTARLVFEQSYSEVEGDSASSAELYALLSALSGMPLKQGIAVTGSVNQSGGIQSIGGVNEKIEGFFEICKAKELTGEQGVIIPESNVKNLMLDEKVVEAVRKGEFHLWSVRTIDEGIEILTGLKAGQKTEDRGFEENCINYLVDKCLRELAEKMKGFAISEQTPKKNNT